MDKMPDDEAHDYLRNLKPDAEVYGLPVDDVRGWLLGVAVEHAFAVRYDAPSLDSCAFNSARAGMKL